MTEQQLRAENRPLSQGEIRIRERLKALRTIAYKTMVSISTMDEGAVYTVLVGREKPGKVEIGTQQAGFDNLKILDTVANRDGIEELLEAGGVIPVIRVGDDTESHWIVLSGNLREKGEEGKAGSAVVEGNLIKGNSNHSEASLDKLNEDWIRKFWGKMTEGDASSYAHRLVHELSHFKPKDFLYELVKALK